MRILDIFQHTSSARVDAAQWVDHLHLVKGRGRSVMLNEPWEMRRV